MNILKMKITGYDESSNSLLVAFASDETVSSNPSHYPSYAYQPMNMFPDVIDIETIKKNIAVAGVWQAQQQAKQESFANDKNKIAEYKNLVGQEIQYNVSDLIPNAPDLDLIVEV